MDTLTEGPGHARTVLGEERLANFLAAAEHLDLPAKAAWKAEQLSARTFRIQCGKGRTLRSWRTSFRACGKVQRVVGE